MRRACNRFVFLLLAATAFSVARGASAATLNVTLPTVSCLPGDVVDVPITVSPGPAGLGILSIDFRLTLDPTVVFGAISKPDGFLQNWGAAYSNGTSSFLAAAAAGATPVAGSNTLLNTVQLRLQPHAVVGTSMPITFQHILFNEGTPTVAVTNGVLHVIAPGASAPAPAPGAFALALASSNPVRGSASFACSIPGDGARLSIYGIDGRAVRTVALGALGAGGTYRWDLRDEHGARVRPGVYLARLASGADARSCRLVVID